MSRQHIAQIVVLLVGLKDINPKPIVDSKYKELSFIKPITETVSDDNSASFSLYSTDLMDKITNNNKIIRDFITEYNKRKGIVQQENTGKLEENVTDENNSNSAFVESGLSKEENNDSAFTFRRIRRKPSRAKHYAHAPLPAPPVLSGFETYNMEGSEIGEATYIIPEELKGSIQLPPPEPSQKTYGLAVNDGQVLRNEVRNDYGEFMTSYSSRDGTTRTDVGELEVQPNGAQVLVFHGSYTITGADGRRYRVVYRADTMGYHATQVPLDSSHG